MNMSNFAVVIPMSIHHSGGGDIIWEKVLILAIVSFAFLILPSLIYIIKEYIKHKKKYPELYFYWGDYPLSVILIGSYFAIFVLLLILWITEIIYELRF